MTCTTGSSATAWSTGSGWAGQTTVTGADIADFHARYPDIRTFWRTRPTDTVTVAEVQARGATLVELDKSHFTAEVVAPLKAAGIITATRTITSQEMFQTAYNAGIRAVPDKPCVPGRQMVRQSIGIARETL